MNNSLAIVLAQTLLPFVISPGASFVLTLSASTAGVRFAALKVWTGTALGLAVLAAASALGVARLVLHYPLLQTLLALVGGALLMFWGLRLCRSAPAQTSPPLPARLVASAFTIVVSNVKAITLYVAVLPGLLKDVAPWAFYAQALGIHALMLLVWLLLVSFGLRRLPWLSTLRHVLLKASGVFMVYLGGKSVWLASAGLVGWVSGNAA
ncbi:MAG: LysE family transporter [Cardiobacteriaceae bacterium]|nr:LysE family transporter [Cardiobacteriaceae bacterium]